MSEMEHKFSSSFIGRLMIGAQKFNSLKERLRIHIFLNYFKDFVSELNFHIIYELMTALSNKWTSLIRNVSNFKNFKIYNLRVV